ncbi:MAG TPA: STAS domain-containing protein [Gammaproteobacteria bacterium]|nr:STAS domain-containing protein [Gammaproteobacteria bacterium]
MSQASVTLDELGVLHLKGVLDYSTGPLLRKQGQVLIRNSASKALQLNCAAVEKSSSVGLALLLAFMRDGRSAGKDVELVQLPEDMRKIAQVCGLTEIFGIETDSSQG